MDSKTFNSIIGTIFNLLVILTLLLMLVVTIINTIYFRKLYEDNGSRTVTADTANTFFYVNLGISVLTLLVLLMYFFKRIVVTIWFAILLIITFVGVIGVGITCTIYYKKLWDDGGSESVSSTVGKNMFFFNLVIVIVSFFVFLFFFYRWYKLYTIEARNVRMVEATRSNNMESLIQRVRAEANRELLYGKPSNLSPIMEEENEEMEMEEEKEDTRILEMFNSPSPSLPIPIPRRRVNFSGEDNVISSPPQSSYISTSTSGYDTGNELNSMSSSMSSFGSNGFLPNTGYDAESERSRSMSRESSYDERCNPGFIREYTVEASPPTQYDLLNKQRLTEKDLWKLYNQMMVRKRNPCKIPRY